LGILEIVLMALSIIFIIILIVWLIALIDVLKSDFRNHNKIIWLLTVILLPFVGAIIYFIAGRRQRIVRDRII
jgi:hypothetical protein